MPRSVWVKLAISLPLLVLLLVLEGVPALQGLPLLAIGLGLALLVAERLRRWLRERSRPNLGMVPFMAAALVLLVLFCWGRQVSQLVLLLITIGVVFDLLMIALAAIGEASKRGLQGAMEFSGLAAVGLVLGLALSLVFLLGGGTLGGSSLAGP